MESFWEWLVDSYGRELGRASGDDALLGALLERVVEPVGAAASSGYLRLALAVGGCQADPAGVAPDLLDGLSQAAAAACAIRCSPACSGPLGQIAEDLVEVVRIPTLHQTDTGPFVVALDRRANFGLVFAARRVDLPAASWRAATHDIAWALSAEAASAALRYLGVRVQNAGAAALPRALAAVEQPAVAGPRPKLRSRTKPGTSALKAAPPGEVAFGHDTAASIAGAILGTLQTAAAHECAIAALAAEIVRGGEVDEKLDTIAALLGRILDASRIAIIIRTTVADDEAPTDKLPVLASVNDVRQGVYTRIDTRRLEPTRLERGGSGAVVSRHVTPIAIGGLSVGEIRATDTRAGRAWTPMERSLLGRASRLIAVTLADSQASSTSDSSGLRATDRLTGLEHRGTFERRMKAAINDAARTGEPLSLVRLKIEGLADINETHGYAAGDAVIRHVASRLRERLADDEESALARFAGEGFAILLPGFTQVAATRVADVLVASVGESELPPIGRMRVRAGVATYPECSDTLEGLTAIARERMLK